MYLLPDHAPQGQQRSLHPRMAEIELRPRKLTTSMAQQPTWRRPLDQTTQPEQQNG